MDIADEESSGAPTVHDDLSGESVAESQRAASTDSSGFASCMDAADGSPSPCWAAVAIVMSVRDDDDGAAELAWLLEEGMLPAMA